MGDFLIRSFKKYIKLFSLMHPFDGGCSNFSVISYMRHLFKMYILVSHPGGPHLVDLWLGPGICIVTRIQKILSALDILLGR